MKTIIQNWGKILEYVKEEAELSKVSFDVWLKPLSVYSFEDHVLTIQGPENEIAAMYLRKKFSLFLKCAVGELTGIECDICFITSDDGKEVLEKKEHTKPTVMRESPVNLKNTFESFVVGNNSFAYNAALAVAEEPGIYNPLYLYSGHGMGKTHILHAIVNMIKETNPQTRVFYTTSTDFTNAVIDCLRSSFNKPLREMLADIDVLLIEDIQNLAGKEVTQEEIAYIFTELYQNGKQIVLTADRPPKELSALNSRIQSRCEWGLICDMSAPNYETRMEFLKRTRQERGYMADEQILEYIAKNITSNFCELNAALTRACVYAKMSGKELNLELAKLALKIFIQDEVE